MSRISRLLLSLLLLLGTFTLLRAQNEEEQPEQYAPAQEAQNSHARIVRLSHVEGDVQIDTGNGVENATTNVPVTEGARLLTRSDGWAEVQFEDGSTARLAPGTQLTFTQLGRTPSGKTVTAIDLDQGEAEFKIAAHDGAEFAVTARNKTLLLKHSSRFRVKSTNSDPLELAVFKGEVAVRDAAYGKDIAVKKNETFALDQLDPARYDLEKEAVADELDSWSQQRDQDLSSYASAQSYTQSPYQYGLGDLNYYGQFYDVAGYGSLWQPNGLYPGWDPFMNGYWSYSPGFGYCWVSAYPWGWMPYRYGQWVFINGRGWFWQPGGWGSWARAPRVVNPPLGFAAPAPPFRAGNGAAPGVVRQPGSGITFIGGRAGQPGRRVFANEDQTPEMRMPARSGSTGGMSTRPATETRPATPAELGSAPATGRKSRSVPEQHSTPEHHSTPAETPHSTPHSAPAPAAVPHSAPPPAAVPHSAPEPHVEPAPHVAPPVPHVSAPPASHPSSSSPHR